MAIIKLFGSKKDDEEDGEDLFEGASGDFLEEEDKLPHDDEHLGESWAMTLYRQFSSFLLVRMFILMVGVFGVLFLVYALVKLAVGLILGICTLFRISAFREIVSNNISNVKIAFVGLIGLFIALLSPSLGITIIAAYCMMNLDDAKSTYLLRFLETRLKEFEGE
ncbi:MAG: membrane-bound ClpP family serine protease [Chlamydiales bacterium]|jgi:membrane-bound ClpP family serine protease